MAAHSHNQQNYPTRRFNSDSGEGVRVDRHRRSRRWLLLGLAWISSAQMLCAQQPSFNAKHEAVAPSNGSVVGKLSSYSIVDARIDNQPRAATSLRLLQADQDSKTVREAIQPQLEEVPPKNEDPSPPTAIPPGGSGNNTPPKDNFRPGILSYLPTLKPIGEIDINIATKPKANDNSVPPSLDELIQSSEPIRDTTFALDDRAAFGMSAQSQLVPYQPLYFEEVNLERYGRARPGQRVCSMLRFFGTVPMMPYFMTIHNPNRPMYWNWPYEAGWGAPRVRELPPFSWKAASVQALAFTGAAAVIP